MLNVVKARKFECILVRDELKRASVFQVFVRSGKDKLMVTGASYLLCRICKEFGKYVKFIVEVYVAMPSTQSVCRKAFTVTSLFCFMYYSVSSAIAFIIFVK